MADNRKTLLESSTSLISAHYSLVKALFMAAPFFASQAYAQTCSPVPSCVSLGYSKSNAACTNKIYCPFDTSYTICLDATETKPETCADFGYYSQGNLADLKKKDCAHPDSKYCTCNEVSESEVTDLDLLCYSACNEPTMTCNKINSGYGTRAEKAAEVCEFDDKLCQCNPISDDSEVTMRGLECYSGCSERAFVCSNESQGWLTEAEAKSDYCEYPDSKFCVCDPVERTALMENRDLDCYALSNCTETTIQECSDVSENYYSSDSAACTAAGVPNGFIPYCSCSRANDKELTMRGLSCYDKRTCEVERNCVTDPQSPGCDGGDDSDLGTME